MTLSPLIKLARYFLTFTVEAKSVMTLFPTSSRISPPNKIGVLPSVTLSVPPLKPHLSAEVPGITC